ncbi:GL24650 [Drosophila persimilis]|uniref:GL24650 n=1 Tax=Drosophila persimilis TaxID=7234 RepID=B4H5U8_DROPE|nr:GL24650 [Drosophila persimilis]
MLGRLLSLLKRRRDAAEGGSRADREAPAGRGSLGGSEAEAMALQFHAIVVVVDKASGATDHHLCPTDEAPAMA